MSHMKTKCAYCGRYGGAHADSCRTLRTESPAESKLAAIREALDKADTIMCGDGKMVYALAGLHEKLTEILEAE